MTAAAFLAASASAQTTSVLEGTVTNPNGEALSGVTIVATGPTLERTTTTDARGRYRIPALPVGTYQVSASLEGFSTEKVEGVELALNSTLVLDLGLDLGAVTEAVTVTAEPPLIQTTTSDTGGLVTPEQIETLPVNGRDYLDLMQLVPGVTVNRQADPGSDTATPILGERAGNTVYLIDGMPNRDEFGSGPSSQFNQDSIFEFEVITDGYKAEFGHGSGGVVNVVSQSGGNDLRGLGFLFVRDDALDASNSLDETLDDAPELERYDYGFTLGGALIKDRLFGFSSGEVIDEERQLNFAFPPATPDVIREFESGFDDPTQDDQLRGFLKLTEQLGTRHTLSQQINYSEQELTDFLPLSAAANLPSTRRDYEREQTLIGITDTSVFGEGASAWVYDGYLQYRDSSDVDREAHPEAGPSTIFNIFSSTATFGVFGDLGAVAFGSSLTPTLIDQKYLALGSSGSRSLGEHQIEIGFDYLRTEVDGTESSLVNNQLFATEDNFLQYGPVTSGFFTLLTVGGLTPEDNEIRLRDDYTGAYIQDDWRITNELTLNLGVRWDRNSEFEEDNFSPRLGFAWSPTPKTVVRGSWGLFYDRFRLGLVRDIPDFGGADIRQIQPFSYPQLFQNLTTIAPVLFGICVNPLLTQQQINASGAPCPLGPFPHYGYDALNGLVAPGRAPVPAGTVVTRDNVLELTGLSPEAFLERVNATVPILGGALQWFFGPFGALSHTGAPASQVPVTLDPNFETPYTRGYHLGIQQQLGRNQMVGVEYHHKDFENLLGVRITNLAFEARIPGNELTFDEPNTTTGINGFGPWYEGELDAITVSYTRRMAGNFALSAHYTYTDAEDNLLTAQLGSGALFGSASVGGPSDAFVGRVPLVTDPISGATNANGSFTASNGNPVPQAGTFYNGPDLDRGTSSLAVEHTFVLFGIAELPYGFQVSAIVRLQSGFPFSQTTDAPLDVDGNLNFNARDQDFERNSFEGPSLENVDLRVSKLFRFGEHMGMTLLLEFFNLFNEQNAAALETSPGQPTPFGDPLQVLPGREGQLGVRFEF